MSKKKMLAYALIPMLGLGLLAAGSASAHGMFSGFGLFSGSVTPDEIAERQTQMFEHQASILGLSAAEVKAAWAEGKSMQELMEEKGISEETVKTRLKEQRLT